MTRNMHLIIFLFGYRNIGLCAQYCTTDYWEIERDPNVIRHAQPAATNRRRRLPNRAVRRLPNRAVTKSWRRRAARSVRPKPFLYKIPKKFVLWAIHLCHPQKIGFLTPPPVYMRPHEPDPLSLVDVHMRKTGWHQYSQFLIFCVDVHMGLNLYYCVTCMQAAN